MSGAQLLRKPRHRTPSALLRAGFIGWLLTWSMVLSGHAAAEEHWERNRRFYATVYGDIWAHTNLYSLPLGPCFISEHGPYSNRPTVSSTGLITMTRYFSTYSPRRPPSSSP